MQKGATFRAALTTVRQICTKQGIDVEAISA